MPIITFKEDGGGDTCRVWSSSCLFFSCLFLVLFYFYFGLYPHHEHWPSKPFHTVPSVPSITTGNTHGWDYLFPYLENGGVEENRGCRPGSWSGWGKVEFWLDALRSRMFFQQHRKNCNIMVFGSIFDPKLDHCSRGILHSPPRPDNRIGRNFTFSF